mmetsp:Transcript_11998/g.24698  ORF Transcript_11998/g.24698 Transcript_11998/m.24698 type:complete len:582 (+) Transcript_11998:74-1819(+)
MTRKGKCLSWLLVVAIQGICAVEANRGDEWSEGWGMHTESGLVSPLGHGLGVSMPLERHQPVHPQILSAPHHAGASEAPSRDRHQARSFPTRPDSHQNVGDHSQKVHISSLKVSPDRDESWIVPALTRVMEDDEARSFPAARSGRRAAEPSAVESAPRHVQARESTSAEHDHGQKTQPAVRTAASHPKPKTTAEVHHKLTHSVKPMIQLPEDEAAPDAAEEAPADDEAAPEDEAGEPDDDEEEETKEQEDEKHEEEEDTTEEEEREFEDGVRKALDFNKVTYAEIPLHYWAWCLAVIFVGLTIVISGNLILRHLENYEQPEVQKYVVRILFMAPLYAIDALLCLTFDGVSPFLNVVRDCYEAFTLYSFTKMLYVWLGGEREVIRMMATKRQIALPFPLHSAEPWAMGDEMFYNCKFGVIQYVVIIPFLAIVTFVFAAAGLYEGDQWYTMDLWLSLVSCASATFAIYCLITFYLSMQEELEASVSNALAKFLCVKAVVFFCFWQELFLQLVLALGAVPETEQFSSRHLVGAIQEWLICFEMFVIAICFTLAYPVEEIIELKTLNAKTDDSSYGTFKEEANVV